ncbi:ketopantoate hydroxymethyltransferase [Coniophora puteana RWD-64-598 SS2]|uniref:3-methyl-2-oxobutanoate hydroxymethyltransferase n=1 Tax=Coniophora puteana (strain RWD-64-598) TaxID=741705 RepID=A0A5M3M8L5_CONPW|nr:ketopantoate hydroxymethyltransferase [Coniophora puteana RWD-64-598 SS2]EIW75578.1 ketopantoate hydroxymethyltransferase [Coniophora puteana RWD-64-598 SS2]
MTITIQSLNKRRAAGTPVTMMTAYDFLTARACDTHGVDMILCGDSLAQVCLGYDSTSRLTLDEMIHHCRAVARGASAPFLVGDLPFGSYFRGPNDTVAAAVRMLQEGHAEGVKMEGGIELVDSVRALTRIGIPVMAHVGLTPQRHTALSGYRVQGRTAQGAREILHAALALEDAGAFSIVLEAIPHELGAYITSRLKIPTIGIGAGPWTSGQVLVYDDVMATWLGHKAKFVRRFADVRGEVQKGITSFVDAVKDGSFPSMEEESYVWVLSGCVAGSEVRSKMEPLIWVSEKMTATR